MPIDRPKHRFAMLLAVLAWLFMAHPYEGLRHDGVLYFGQALLHSTVPVLSQDVFFSGGSQDQYSIYAHLMVPLYEHLGRLSTHVGVLMCSWLLMAGAVLRLLRRFEPSGPLPYWGLFAYTVMSPIYGGGWVFSYGEAFVTARTFAEPALLWSLAALMDDRRRVAVGLQVLAAFFHPLMTLPVIVLSWCFLAESDRRWLWLLLSIPAALLVALAGIPPLDGLLKTYDPYWWSVFDINNHHLILGNWNLHDHLTVLLDVAVLLAVTRLRPTDIWTRLIYAAVITTVAMLALTAIGVDLLHAVLLTQLQLWRAHWVSHLMAMALAPWLVARLWSMDGLWKASACALGLALLNSHIGLEHGVATLLLWGLCSLLAWRTSHVTRVTVMLACSGILIGLLGLTAYQLDAVVEQQSWELPGEWFASAVKIMAFPTIAFSAFAALLHLARWRRAGAGLAAVVSGLLLCLSLAHWDQRTDLARAIESPAERPHPFSDLVPDRATVYWPNQLIPVWGLLERASHYSEQQGAGVLFNRQTALIYAPRRETYRPIRDDRERCRTGAQFTRNRKALAHCDMPTNERLVTLCSQPDPPDFLVLVDRLKPEPLATWTLPQRRDVPQTFALYACSQLTRPES
ncbi:hypothetical protein ACG04R_08375 [Roseateles sp. BYS78W]|uniref:Uncharacterized protein n=1 Tax=Pelomonas candidula TaxID=3299025 RepID=A0ABW7HB31_9BURK